MGVFFISIPVSRARDATFIRCFFKHPSPVHAKSTATSSSSSLFLQRGAAAAARCTCISPHQLRCQGILRPELQQLRALFPPGEDCVVSQRLHPAPLLQPDPCPCPADHPALPHRRTEKSWSECWFLVCVCSWINVCVSVGNCMCELCVCL